MREKIALAIHPSSFSPTLNESFTPQFIAEMQGHAFAKADAVLAAMREPTEAMMMAARNVPLPIVHLDSMAARQDLETKAHWQAMIDAARSES